MKFGNIYYRLGEDGKTPVPMEELNEAGWKQDRTVQKDKVTAEGVDITVSTMFLMIDHSWEDDGVPILFETMIFGGERDGYQERYATWDEAVEGHQKALDLVQNKLTLENL